MASDANGRSLSAGRRLRQRAALLAFLTLVPLVTMPLGQAQQQTLQTQVILQPCVAGQGRCDAPPVTTQDGRIFLQIYPAYAGAAYVYLERPGPPMLLFSCDVPLGTGCSKMVDTGRAGTYNVFVEFHPAAQGILLLEAASPA